jgi:hypothetical protein
MEQSSKTITENVFIAGQAAQAQGQTSLQG